MEFESQSGNKYWFDNKIGISIPLTPILNNYFKNVSYDITKDKNKCNEDDFLYNYKFIKKIEKLRQFLVTMPPRIVEPDEIKKIILKEGALQLTLGVTEDCNLKCKYCIYSDTYEYSRKPSKNKMDFNTAKKALDYYLSLTDEGRRYNPNIKPAIGFYGGEPLLNFDLIKKCVDYLDVTYPDIDFFFSITTNHSFRTLKQKVHRTTSITMPLVSQDVNLTQ
ncbi:MAG: 4Fe-4S cluster-binding domain-containing protein [Methanoregula sp.]|nr:4Fe-4S cluster-binding domain-containing protein [Methanoregula sp.]